jgi:hypothetical protein
MHSGPSLGEEAADGRVFAEWLEELDATLADTDRRRTDSLILHRRAMLDPSAEQPLVRSEGRVEVFDRDS